MTVTTVVVAGFFVGVGEQKPLFRSMLSKVAAVEGALHSWVAQEKKGTGLHVFGVSCL